MSLRRAALLLFGVTALAAPARARAQAIPAGLGGNPSALVGDSLDVPVVVDMSARSDRLGAFALRLHWNPAVLRFEAGLSGSFGSVTANVDSAAQGVIRLAGANPAGVGGLVTLGIGRFIVLAGDTTTLTLTFSELYAATTYVDLRAALALSNGQFCAAQGRYGDINGDGAVNSGDALIALTNAVGLPVGSYDVALGDVSGDGVTDTRDALIMLSAAVGIDVSAFPRLGQVLGGACATGATVTLALTPAAATGVLVGQEVTFEARATGPTGALVAIPNVVFRSSDTTVLAFEGGADPATAMARGAGTATVTAVRDAHDSAQTPVTVVARRGTHWVDAKAATAANQLGTQTLPFATIAAALTVARGGDTIRPQPGRYGESLIADSAVVLMGDTLPDGTRPVLAGGGVGVVLLGPGSSEVIDLELDGYADAITIIGPSQVLLRGIRAVGVGYGVLTGPGTITRLQIESSRLTGMGPSVPGDAVNLGSTVVDSVVVQGTEISDFADGLYGNEVLYVGVHGSSLHDLGGSGVDASCEAPLTFVMDSSSVVNTYSWSVAVSGVSSASFSHNRFFNVPVGNTYTGYTTGVQVLGKGWVRFQGDSINQSGSGDPEWLNVNGIDSLRIDSVWARLPNGYGFAYDVPLVRVTNSQFVDLTGQALYIDFYGGGGTVALDNVAATGDPGCDLCATAFEVYNAATTVTNFTGTNLWAAVTAYGDSGLTVTGSEFQHVAQPVAWSVADIGTGAHLLVRASQFVGFATAVVSELGSVAVDSNDFQGSQEPAIQIASPEGSVQVVGNAFAGVYGGVNVSPVFSLPVTIAGNSLTGISGYGVIGGGGADTTNVGYVVTGNQVTCSGTGSSVYGIEIENADAAVAGNLVQGCGGGIVVSANMVPTATPHVMDITSNTVTVPAAQYGAYGGIVVQGMVEAHVASNTVSADTSGYLSTYGDIAVVGDSTSGGLVIAMVDSNVVTGGTGVGIHVTGVDSAAVLLNTVQNVAQAGGCGGCGDGGIWVSGPIRTGATIHGNLVRGILGTGITASNSEDVTVVVDSNLVSGNVVGLALGEWGGMGPVRVTRNRITGNTAPAGQNPYGVVFYYANAEMSVVDSNNIVGNKFGAGTADGYTYGMPYNWWGDPSGPSCSGEPCSGGSTGDSVANMNINWYPALSTPVPSGLPSNAPPVRLASSLRLPAVRQLAVVPQGAPITHAVAAPRWTPRAVPPRAAAAARVPGGLKAAQADALRRQWDRRSADLTARSQGQAARASRVAAGASARAAWIESVEHAAAQRDSLRAERLKEQIAAQRALHARRS